MTSSWREILIAVIAILIPILYTAVTGALPTFPIDQATFGEIITWIIGLLIGGWQLNKAKISYQVEKYDTSKINKDLLVQKVVTTSKDYAKQRR